VTLIVANSLRHGTRAGLLNVANTQLGLALLVAVVGIGLTSVIELMGTGSMCCGASARPVQAVDTT
jgi:homoserine/homoserine lactone efflux protein